MEDIDAGLHQWREELAQALRGFHQARGIVLLLPLREAEDDREIRTDRRAHRPHQLDGEARAIGQAAAVLVVPLVAAFPEELVDQVAVGAVDLHPVHADRLGVAGGLGEGGDDVLDVGLAHAVDQHLAVLGLLHRAVAGHAGVRLHAQAPNAADVPELRNDAPALGMHRVDHLLPAGQGVLAIEARHVRIAVGGLVADRCAFADDQAGRGALGVVLDDLGVGYAAGGKVAGHRCHHHTGGQFQGAEAERLEQGFYGGTHGRTPEGEWEVRAGIRRGAAAPGAT